MEDYMKKFLFLMVALCVLLAGCNGAENAGKSAVGFDHVKGLFIGGAVIFCDVHSMSPE